MGKLDGKVAMVTGGSRGIGRAIARAYAAEGASVAVTYHPAEVEPSELLDELRDSGGTAVAFACQVADDDQVRDVVQKAGGALGRIDILVANAGYAAEVPVTSMTPEEFDTMVAVHLGGTFRCVRHVLPSMLERRSGTIITMASQIAYIGAENLAHYAAAKGGIIAFTKSLAREVIRQGVRVNGIAPGPISTGILPSNPNFDAKLLDRLPIARFGTPEEVSPTAVFLASGESSYYVGQFLGPNGGEVML
ncbi:MAG TPA: 3-oxoacyl-ACP reductase family protein [Thermomicrobiales bacterium]|nr:3-oxoacyl-ACP reductase family protein [Thermomicrobiales bacterium]